MTTRSPRVLDTPRFALLDSLVRRMQAGSVDEATRQAVAVLTADADPDRADRLEVRPGEPAGIVERLAVWALHRAGDDAVMAARHILDSASAGDTADADLELAS